ncbi:hypothetical protein J437_LFUL004235 [Ladona fulva]|uniref:Reverse transcriptase domain-containing protein n=1 Tax=Ladona fulva TaxID=123851 RepID=A0A8K0K827_LADFU|nr:hypothetical protein J437_LFUL004235 [Ladona fulva]
MTDNSKDYHQNLAVELTNDVLTNIAPSDPVLTNCSEVSAIIEPLKPNKALGHDQFSNKILKIVAKIPCFLDLLTNIFNAFLKIDYFTETWKISHVLELPKPNKDPTSTANYRSITLLSSLSKVYENIILNSLLSHAKDKQIIISQQMGFQKQGSKGLPVSPHLGQVGRTNKS